MNASRPGGLGLTPISYTEIKAYCDLMNCEFDEIELMLIRRFDNIFLSHQASEEKKKLDKQTK